MLPEGNTNWLHKKLGICSLMLTTVASLRNGRFATYPASARFAKRRRFLELNPDSVVQSDTAINRQALQSRMQWISGLLRPFDFVHDRPAISGAAVDSPKNYRSWTKHPRQHGDCSLLAFAPPDPPRAAIGARLDSVPSSVVRRQKLQAAEKAS